MSTVVSRAGIFASLVAFLCLALSPDLRAHTLQSTTAKVTLRESHLKVEVQTDIIAWLQALDGGAHKVPVERLALVDPEAFAGLVTEAKERLVKETQLSLDSRKLALAAVHFPSLELITKAAQTCVMARALDAKAKGEHMLLGLEARLLGQPERLSIQLPASLGETSLAFVEPKHEVIAAGQSAHYELGREDGLFDLPWVITGLLALLLIGVLTSYRGRTSGSGRVG